MGRFACCPVATSCGPAVSAGDLCSMESVAFKHLKIESMTALNDGAAFCLLMADCHMSSIGHKAEPLDNRRKNSLKAPRDVG
jgi:hypothetical protein